MNETHHFTLRTGADATIRRVTRDDTALLVDLYHNLSKETKQLRFHGVPPNITDQQLWEQTEAQLHFDPALQVGLIASSRIDGVDHAIGEARFSRGSISDTTAEAAIMVRDDYQNAGLGKFLLRLLAYEALSMGITHFEAWVRSDNLKIFRILNSSNFPIIWHTSRGETHVMVPLQLD